MILIIAAIRLSFISCCYIPKIPKPLPLCRWQGAVQGDLSTDIVIVTPDGKNEITIKDGVAYRVKPTAGQALHKMGAAHIQTRYLPA